MKSLLYSRPLDNLVRSALGITVATGSVVSGYGTDRLANGVPAHPFKISGTSLDLVFEFAGPVLPALPAILHSTINVAARLQGHSSNSWSSPDVDVAFGVPTIDAAGFFSAPWKDLTGYAAKTWWRLHVSMNSYPITIGELWLGSTARYLEGTYLYDGAELSTEGQTLVHQTNSRVELTYEQATARAAIAGTLMLTDAELADVEALVTAARFQARPFLLIPRDDVDDAWFVKFAADRLAKTPLAPDVWRAAFPVRQVGRDLAWISVDA